MTIISNKTSKPLDSIRNLDVLDGRDVDRSENLHRLFMYPAMMVPKIQSIILQSLSNLIPPNANVIDPFMGSGTSLISCTEFGYNLYGQDVNPLAVLLTKSKLFVLDIERYTTALTVIAERISNDTSETVDIEFEAIDKWFSKESQVFFSKIRRAIMSIEEQELRNFFWVMMAEAVRTGSNDRTSTFKLHRRSEEDIASRHVDVLKSFLTLSKRGIADLQAYRDKLTEAGMWKDGQYVGSFNIKWGNTQKSIDSDVKFDVLVSSPPYGDNQTTVTYGQTSYLPLRWIDAKDLECPYDYLRTTQEIDSQSLGGRSNKKAISEYQTALFERVPSLKSFISAVPENEKYKYNKTISFIKDFDECLVNIVKAMKSDAYYIWTIGNRFVGGREVPNDQILIDLMKYHGIDMLDNADRQILNKKQPRKNNYSNTMEKERILIFHKSKSEV